MDPTASTGGLNPIDVAAVLIVAFTFVFGLRSGFFPQLGGLLGAGAGACLVLLLLPVARDQLTTMDPPLRALIIIGVLIMVVGIGEATGSAIGASIRERLGGGLLGSADRLAGGWFVLSRSIFGFRLMLAGSITMWSLFAIALLSFYPLSKERAYETRDALEARRGVRGQPDIQ